MTEPQKRIIYAVLQQGGGSLSTLAYVLNISRSGVKSRLLSTCRALGILDSAKPEEDYLSNQLVELILDRAAKLLIASAETK